MATLGDEVHLGQLALIPLGIFRSSGMELIVSEMSESRLEKFDQYGCKVWNEPLLADIVFPKIHIGV